MIRINFPILILGYGLENQETNHPGYQYLSKENGFQTCDVRWRYLYCKKHTNGTSRSTRHSFLYICATSLSRSIGTLKQTRRRRQRRRDEAIGFMSKTTALHLHHAFYYTSLAETRNLLMRFFVEDENTRDEFSFLLLNMDKSF